MSFEGQEAVSIENHLPCVAVVGERAPVAEIFHTEQGINPLWISNGSIDESSKYHPKTDPQHGGSPNSNLLIGILGHDVCLGCLRSPSAEDATHRLTVHGESSVVRYEIQAGETELSMKTQVPAPAALKFRRAFSFGGHTVASTERVQHGRAMPTAFACTQHFTLVPQFSMRALDSAVSVASSPKRETMVGYRWNRDGFPWLGFWSENRKRSTGPWNDWGVACGLEFGVSPVPETRRQMIEQAPLFGTPVYRCLPALVTAEGPYQTFVQRATESVGDGRR